MGARRKKEPTRPIGERGTGNRLLDFCALDLRRPNKVREFFLRYPCPPRAPAWHDDEEQREKRKRLVCVHNSQAFHVDDLTQLPDPLPPAAAPGEDEEEQSWTMRADLDDLYAHTDEQETMADVSAEGWETLEAGKRTALGRLGLELTGRLVNPDSVCNMLDALEGMAECKAEFRTLLQQLIAWTAGIDDAFPGALQRQIDAAQGPVGMLEERIPGLGLRFDLERKRAVLTFHHAGYLEEHLLADLLEIVTAQGRPEDLDVNEKKAGAGLPELLYQCEGCGHFGWKTSQHLQRWCSESCRGKKRRQPSP